MSVHPAGRNRSLVVHPHERAELETLLQAAEGERFNTADQYRNRLFLGDSLDLCRRMNDGSVDLIFADPPYPDIRKRFSSRDSFLSSGKTYREWLSPYLAECARILKPGGSFYLCGDWRGSADLAGLLSRYFIIRSRITWEREKGRGAKYNWKNSHEDIWFCTLGDDYYFNVDEVKLLREVKAPYRDESGPRDWQDHPSGRFRLTHPGNCWTDLTVPFWSMGENTSHPTQKPEKLLARVLLASSRPGDLIFDPFMGSGTSAATAVKLGRNWCGAELEEEYCLYTLKRVGLAAGNSEIQGLLPRPGGGWVFLERNTSPESVKQFLQDI